MTAENRSFSDICRALAAKRWTAFLLLLCGGVLTGLTLIFPKLGLFEWLTLVPTALFLLVRASDEKVRLRTLYGYGFFFFMFFYLTVFHWFINLYPLDFIAGMTKGAALSVVLLGWWGLSLFQALQGALVFVLGGAVLRSRICRRFPLLSPFAFAGLWAIYEWWQTVGWFGVPWGRLPIGQSAYVVGLQTASLFGSYFVTFLLVAVNGLVAYVILERAALRVGCATLAAVLVFQYGVGSILYFTTSRDKGEPIAVAAAQGNISSHEKWNFSLTMKTREVYAQYTAEAAQNGAKIVVWPETALPHTLVPDGSHWDFVSELAREHNVTILVGAFHDVEWDVDEDDEDWEEIDDWEEDLSYNAVFCFLPDGTAIETVYAKRHLVPFGEYVPMRELVETVAPALSELTLSSDELAAGEGGQLFELEEGTVGTLICFDSIYEELTLESVREGAELICLSTNDSWFTDSAALYMHNAQAQLRAVETGRYVVRSANTGISTVIAPTGAVIDELEPLVGGIVEAEVYARDSLTLYTRIGNLFVYLLMAAFVSLGVWETVGCVKKRKMARVSP